MKIDKEIIKRSFSRAASTYDESSELQKEVAGELFLKMRAAVAGFAYARAHGFPAPYETPRILDIGSGTGRLPALIGGSYQEARVIASDLSLEMLKRSRENLGGVNALLAAAECEDLPFREAAFDMVVSSLTYQWAHDLGKAFAEACRVLRPGGLFLFSTLGPATLKELRLCYPSAGYWNTGFSSSEEIEEALGEARLEKVSVEKRPVVKTYESLTELLKTLKSIGASPPIERGKGLTGKNALMDAGKEYIKRFSAGGGVMATYDVIFAVARKA